MKTTKTAAIIAILIAAAAQGQTPPPSTLPIKQITLFTSGVAYTERAGTVEGDAAVPLTFRTAQINDILKSMVLLDKGGKVQPATYASRDPIGRSLQSFAVDVTANSSRESVLASLRGAKVSVTSTGKPTIEGQIVGVEQRQVAGADGKPIMASYISLLTDFGLVSIALDSDKTVKLLDERLNKEFHDALALLATGTDDQRRSVMLHFAGAGKRDVTVGYVMEAPIWKISYRLLLGAAKPYLQGWALVENTTDEDWKEVNLSLVSGRPISFIQDLYQPLYIPRPVVGPDVVASPYPQTHDEALQADRKAGAIANQDTLYNFAATVNRAEGAMGPSGPNGAIQGYSSIQRRPTSSLRSLGGMAFSDTDAARQSVDAQAAGEKSGELFQYAIATPVSLPRQQAAMIPVIAQDIEAEKVSLYNADTGPKFPMNAVRIHNTTTLHLKGGPVTLFDSGVYAGDARMEDVPPGDSRLITYAVDLSLACERQGAAITTVDTTVTVKHGLLLGKRRELTETTYTLKSKADKPRKVLVEHPFNADYQLDAPAKPEERTATLYRFAVTVNPGESQTLKVVTERPLSQEVAVLDGDVNLILYYSNRKDISANLKAALQQVVLRRAHIEELRSNAEARANEVTSIGNDQERIRKNMEALDKSSALYKRYVSELDGQESKIELLRQEAIKLRADAAAAALELRTFVDGISE